MQITGEFGQAVLIRLEDGSRRVEAAVEPFRLQAGFIAFARGGVEAMEGNVAFRLRIEDIGIAAVDRDIGVDVVDGADIGADLVFRAVFFDTVGGADRFQIDRVEADNALKLIGKVQVDSTIDARRVRLDLFSQIRVRIGRLGRWRDDAVQDRRVGKQVGELLPLIAGRMRRIDAQHDLVLAAEQADIAGGDDVEHVLLDQRRVDAAIGVDAQAGHRIRRARWIEQLGVFVIRLARIDALDRPAIVESIAEFAEGLVVVRVPVGPRRAGIGRDVVIDRRAVGIDQRQGAPGIAVGQVVLLRIAAGGLQLRRDIPRQDAVIDVPVDAVIVEVRIGARAGIDEAAFDRAVLVERAGNVRGQARIVPRTIAGIDIALDGLGRTLADIVDRRRRITGAGQHAGGAADGFDAVEQGRVERADLQAPIERLADAIDLEVDDVEAARIVIGAVGFIGLDIDAGDGRQHLVGVGQGELLDLRRRNHRHRLRRLAQRQIEAGSAG